MREISLQLEDLTLNTLSKSFLLPTFAMMKTICLTTIIFWFLALPNTFAQQLSSERLTKEQLSALVVENPDTVLLILDQIGDAGTKELPPYRISLLRGIAYNEKRMFAYVDKYAREALDSKDIKSNPKDETNALTLLSCSQSYFGNIQGCIETLTRALEIARNTNNLPGELNVLTTMAKNYFTLGDRKSGYDIVETTIRKGTSSQDVRVLANVSAAYGVKTKELHADGKYSAAIEECHKRLKLIARMDKVGGAPEGYTDQQRAYAYASIASSAEEMGNKDVAAKAFRDFSATKYGRSDVGRYYIVDYLLDSKQFSIVLEYTRPLFAMFQGPDTINNDFYDLLVSNANAQNGLGNYKSGFNLLQRADVIRDSLYMREENTLAEELATMFTLNEKTLELDKEKAKTQRTRILLWAVGSVCLLVVVILVILWRQYRMTKRNQHLAVVRIEELIKEREKQFQPEEEDSEADRKMFNEMEYKIIKEKLFVESSFNRDGIAKATGLSRNKVILLIRQYTGLTPNDYINKLRVEHSVKLIKGHPEWSIDGIAESCGYVRTATYYSHFNKFYGITPAQYRKALKSSSAGGGQI